MSKNAIIKLVTIVTADKKSHTNELLASNLISLPEVITSELVLKRLKGFDEGVLLASRSRTP